MKGIVFTELLEMVEAKLGADLADQLLDECELESGGAYTALGTYDHQEILTLVVRLSELTGTPVADLVKTFGHHLLFRFAIQHPRFFEEAGSAFTLLSRVEDHIHVEVRKLYPDAELPSFACEALAADRFVLTYSSKRPFADLAEGLILGCIEHFQEDVEVDREDLPGEAGTHARFKLRKRS